MPARIINKSARMGKSKRETKRKTRASTPSCGCPDVKLSDWELKEHVWNGKTFYTKRLNLFLGVPFGIGKKIEQTMDEVIEKNYGLNQPVQILSKHGAFSGRVMVGLKSAPKTFDKNVMIFRKAKVFSKVHTGPYNRISESMRDLNEYVMKTTGKKANEFYFWYASCPDCFAGKNQKTIIFAKV